MTISRNCKKKISEKNEKEKITWRRSDCHYRIRRKRFKSREREGPRHKSTD